MFGGLAFMVNTHLACGVIHDDLLVRVGKENFEDAIGPWRVGVRPSPAARCAAS